VKKLIFTEQNFRFFDLYDSLELGFYFVIIGYYFLLFAYFLFMRWRVSKRIYWLFLSLLFLFLAGGRVFFIVYYFYIPELEGSVSTSELISLFMFYYRFATFFTWLGIACLMGILGVLLFPPDIPLEKKASDKKPDNLIEFLKRNIKQVKIAARCGLIAFPIIVAILALSLPDNVFMDPDLPKIYNYKIELIVITFGDWSYPIGRFVLNLVLLPLIVPIVPIIFLYLAWKTFGVLRRSYGLMAIGYCIYFSGRITQGIFEAIEWFHYGAILSPLLILLSLFLIVVANNYEQLK